MSGHSKWSTIKRQKGVADIRRGQTFTKLANAITIAVREGSGSDPGSNFRLRLVIDQARSANMPKENIQRAIERGLGAGGSAGQLESAVYEAYGPGKVVLVVEATTDNKNRTTSEVKNMIERAGGTFVSPGTVSWMFSDEGLVVVAKEGRSFDEVFEMAAEAGALDVVDSPDVVDVYTKPADLESVKKVLTDKGFTVQSAEISKKPSTTVQITDGELARKILTLFSKLEDLDDVQKVWSNFDIPEDLLTGVKS